MYLLHLVDTKAAENLVWRGFNRSSFSESELLAFPESFMLFLRGISFHLSPSLRNKYNSLEKLKDPCGYLLKGVENGLRTFFGFQI